MGGLNQCYVTVFLYFKAEFLINLYLKISIKLKINLFNEIGKWMEVDWRKLVGWQGKCVLLNNQFC